MILVVQASYNYNIVEKHGFKFLLIEDLNLGNKSVTNDIENVVRDIQGKIKTNILEYVILYSDSEGNWDGWNFQYKVFFPVGGVNANDAMFRYKQIRESGKQKFKK